MVILDLQSDSFSQSSTVLTQGNPSIGRASRQVRLVSKPWLGGRGWRLACCLQKPPLPPHHKPPSPEAPCLLPVGSGLGLPRRAGHSGRTKDLIMKTRLCGRPACDLSYSGDNLGERGGSGGRIETRGIGVIEVLAKL